MFKTLLPIFAIIISIAVFFTYVKPTFENIRLLQNEIEEYRNTIEVAGELRAQVDALIAKRNSISQIDLERLEIMLPDNIDEVEVLLTFDTLARNNGLEFGDITVGDTGNAGTSDVFGLFNETPPEIEDEKEYFSLDIEFSVQGEYNDLRAFISDIESNLAFTEFMEIKYDVATANLEELSASDDFAQYNFTVRLFGLKSRI